MLNHYVAFIRERHFVDNVDDEALDRDLHVLGKVDLVDLLKHLLEALAEREVAEDADGLLGPNFVDCVDLCLLELQPDRLRGLLRKCQARAEDMPAVRVGKDEVKCLWDLVIHRQVDPVGEAELCDFAAELVAGSVAKGVAIVDGRVEPGAHQVELLEVHQALLVHSKPVSHHLAVGWQTVLHLLILVRGALAFDDVDIVNGHVTLLGAALEAETEDFLAVRSAGGGARLWHNGLLPVEVILEVVGSMEDEGVAAAARLDDCVELLVRLGVVEALDRHGLDLHALGNLDFML